MQLKKVKVEIGDKEFCIKELTCLGRNTLLDVVGSFSFADIFKSVLPLLEELGIKIESGDEGEQVSKLISLGLENEAIWGGLVACFINVLNISPQVICLSLDSLDESMQKYVSENITVAQEPIVLKQIIEINKLPQTIKNYKSLLTEVRGLMTTAKTS